MLWTIAVTAYLAMSSISSVLMAPDERYRIVTEDINLMGKRVVLPEGSILDFRGGVIYGGTLVGNNTRLVGDVRFDCEIDGSFSCGETKLSWFLLQDIADHDVVFKRAVELCSSTSSKILDGEGIPIELNKSFVFSEKNDIYLRNLNVTFHPSSHKQSMFVFDSNVRYKGGNKYIKDCLFRCDDKNSFLNVSCLVFRRWYNTTGFIADNIHINGFSGYAIVNCGYMQESVFSNIVCRNVGGLVSYNTDAVWGTNKGSSNIIHFDNCSINNGIKGYNPSVQALIDLHNCGEICFSNLVMQGASKGQKQKALRVNASNYSVPTTLTLDGCWVEFTTNDTPENTTIEINTPCRCVLNRRCPLMINVNSDDVVLELNCSNLLSADEMLDNIRIAKGKKVLVRFDGYYTKSLSLTKIHDYISKGYIIDFANSYNPWIGSSLSIAVKLESESYFDGMKNLIEQMTGESYRGLRTYMTCEDGCNVLVFEDANGSHRNMIFPTPKILFPDIDNSIMTIVRDCLFRITLTSDVTASGNLSISAASPFYSKYYSQQCAAVEPIPLKVGDKKGMTTGWFRVSDVTEATKAWLLGQCYGNVKNVRLEIAKLDYFRSNVTFHENVYINNDGKLSSVNRVVPHYVMSPSTKMDKSLWNFIRGATAFWHIGDDVYYSHNGVVRQLTSDVIAF